MDFLYIIGTLFDISVNHVVALAHLIKDLRLNKNLLDINEDIYLKIEEVDNKLKKSKGFFSSLSILEESIPNPLVGDWAIIKSGNTLLICVCNTDGEWNLTEDEYTEELNLDEYIKKSNLKTINNLTLIGEGNIEIQLEGNDLLGATSERDGLMSKESYSTLLSIKNLLIPLILLDIENLLFLIGNSGSDIQEIIDKYNTIKEFIENLDPEEDDVLNGILEQINSLKSEIRLELQEYKAELDSIKERLSFLESSNISTTDKYKHKVITKARYEALEKYEKDTIYLVTDFLDEASVFGDTFPFILGGIKDSTLFGETFPFTLD